MKMNNIDTSVRCLQLTKKDFFDNDLLEKKKYHWKFINRFDDHIMGDYFHTPEMHLLIFRNKSTGQFRTKHKYVKTIHERIFHAFVLYKFL